MRNDYIVSQKVSNQRIGHTMAEIKTLEIFGESIKNDYGQSKLR